MKTRDKCLCHGLAEMHKDIPLSMPTLISAPLQRLLAFNLNVNPSECYILDPLHILIDK